MAFFTGRFQSAKAAPDDGFVATVVPVDSLVKLSAFVAENDPGKTMLAEVAVVFATFC